jgi:perosamine synthetase
MIRLSKPNIPEEAIQAVVEVLRSGYLVQGEYVKDFEEALCNYLKVKNAVVVSSGTAALHLALIALDIKKGDEVIVPAFTFPATANVVELVGAKPVFVDINLTDFCIDTTKIEEKITSKTRAIMPVHEFGQAAKMDDIINIALKYKLKIVEDAACALGSEFNGRKVGTFGSVGCFSFHPRKAITTGEGGVMVTNDDGIADKLRTLRNHGISYLDGKVDFIDAGFNYRMTDFQAVLGLYQMKNLEDDIKHRINLAHEYDKLLSDIKWIKTPVLFENRRMVYQTYHILVGNNINRDSLMQYLRKNDIEVNYGAQALNCIKYYREKYRLVPESNSNATTAFNNGIALPIGIHINDFDIEHINNIIKYWL